MRHLDTPERAELHKLQMLKEELGELSQAPHHPTHGISLQFSTLPPSPPSL